MSKIEDLLGMAADSHDMPGWNDGLSKMVDSVNGVSSSRRVLSMDDLEMVAGGVDYDARLAERLKKSVLK